MYLILLIKMPAAVFRLTLTIYPFLIDVIFSFEIKGKQCALLINI